MHIPTCSPYIIFEGNLRHHKILPVNIPVGTTEHFYVKVKNGMRKLTQMSGSLSVYQTVQLKY